MIDRKVAGAIIWEGRGVDEYTGVPLHTNNCPYRETRGAMRCECGVSLIAYRCALAKRGLLHEIMD